MGNIRLRGVSLVALAGLALAAATPAWASGTVSGSAFGASVNATVAGVNVTAGPTPTVTLPPTGGNVSQSLATICAGTACSGPSSPSMRPCRTARRMILRST